MSKKKVIPLGYRVLVERQEPEMEKGNIIIPQDVQKKEIAAQTQGVIVAIGPRAWTDKGDQASKCEVGDKVMFTRYSGLAIDPDDSYSHILINDRDILGLVDE